VSLLLANGAHITALTTKGETPAALCSNPEVHKLLVMEPGGTIPTESSSNLPITPYYLKHQPLNGRVDMGTSAAVRNNTEGAHVNSVPVTNPVKGGHHDGNPTQNDGKL
jgi:hypothetical protein